MENTNDNAQDLIDNISEQLQELEVLTAMFPDELLMTDPSLLIDAQDFCNSQGQSSVILQSLTFDLSLVSDNCSTEESADFVAGVHFKLSVKLPKSYPSVRRPELSITADTMSRTELTNAKGATNDFVSTLPLGEQILLEIIMWMKENLVTFRNSKDDSNDSLSERKDTKEKKTEEDDLVSMWLYMHHIYSKHKRKDIQNWSRDYDLTGFSLPGKPGVVHIEGVAANVDAYFDRLKSLPWKSIKCRCRNKLYKRVFDDFKELSFEPHGARNYHMDLGLFYNFLVEHGLCHMFKEIFGVEGQLKDND